MTIYSLMLQKLTFGIARKLSKIILLSLLIKATALHAEESSYGISGNPGAVNILTGTGELGDLFQIPKSSGVRLGGVWLGDYNALVSGRTGVHHNRVWT